MQIFNALGRIVLVPVDQIVRAQDYDRAAAMLRKMAEQGNAEAQHRLAALYRIGRGVPQDDALAFKWMKAAADQGHVTAQFRLWDTATGEQVAGQQYSTDSANARRVAHMIADAVFSRVTGEKGFFDSRIVYVDETGAVGQRLGANAILRFDPKTEKFDSFPLPDRYAGVRQLAGRKGESPGCRIGCRQALCAEDRVKYASGEYRGAKLRRMRGWSARRRRFCDRVRSGVDRNRGPNFPISLHGGQCCFR